MHIHSRPYSTPNMEDPVQKAAHDSKVIESLANVDVDKARPFVASV